MLLFLYLRENASFSFHMLRDRQNMQYITQHNVSSNTLNLTFRVQRSIPYLTESFIQLFIELKSHFSLPDQAAYHHMVSVLHNYHEVWEGSPWKQHTGEALQYKPTNFKVEQFLEFRASTIYERWTFNTFRQPTKNPPGNTEHYTLTVTV